MNSQSQEVLQSALKLSESDRAEIAASLIESLDAEEDEDSDALWAVEIERRLGAIDRGEVKTVPWDDVLAEMRQRR